MSGPTLLLVGPLVPALLIFIGLRRWTQAAGICGFFSVLLLALMIARVDLQPAAAGEAFFAGDELSILGRSLLLTAALRSVMLLIYAASALLFLLSSFWSQGPDFVPAGLAALAPLAFALMITPLAYGVVALLLAAALLSALVQGQRPGLTTASLRYLLLTALAVPALLVAGWMIESQQFALGTAVWRLLLLGVTLLLAGFPFYIWVRPLLNESRPLTAVFVLAPVQLAILVFVWRWLQQSPDLLRVTNLGTYLGWSGAATALVAAFLAANARDARRLLGSLVLADMGATLVCLSQGVAGIEQAMALLLLRFVSLLLAAIGLEWARQDLDGAGLSPAGRLARHPLAASLFAYGALSLIGLPLSPGFAGRWSAIALGGAASPWWALFLILSLAGGVAGLLRVLWPALVQFGAQDHPPLMAALLEQRLTAALVAGSVLLALIVSLFPWPLLNLVARLGDLS